jgi:adenine deaminase
VRGSLALPIAGLMSDAPLARVVADFQALHRSAQRLGTPMARPFMALSFLALPVIPELRLTDRGLVDVERGCIVPLHVA